MRFEIYNSSRLDDQVKFIEEVSNSWNWKPWYPSKEELLEIYSRESFTSDTRHYVYDGSELVGFLSSAVEGIVDGKQTGSIHIPFVKDGYKDVEEALMKKTMEVLKSKGVEVVHAYIMPAWGNVEEIITKRGFTKKLLIAYRTLIKIKDFVDKGYSKPDNLQNLDIRKDRELVVEMIHKIRGIPKPEVENIVEDLIEKNLIIAGSLIKEGEDISVGLLYKAYQPEKGFLRIFCLSKNKERNMINGHFRLSVQKADEVGIKLVWHQVPNIRFIDQYKELNLNFEPFNEYVLHLK
ncbi:MAG: hypothetical protein KAU62_08580 [Candidatus Heimdallarchaeota archaeon]|nr:hypothetical protein [Candidatus Heimdallarchaeota archaeon]MCK4611194.1 hypothetical protein [Candidatus Heimdallarchaeota archaeon]